MNCTDKEWQHCRVEKMGCEGCYYNKIEEDDVKIIEDLINKYNSFFKPNGVSLIEITPEQINAMESVLDRYRVYRKQLNKAFDNGFISTSIIENKIDELDKEKLKYDNDLRIYTLRNTFDFQKEILQELLEERNK